jgi:hypothetical protein
VFLGIETAEWTALGTVATAAVALAAAVFAGFQVVEARRSREDQIRPFVVVDVQPSKVWRNALNLVVENVGRTVAYDVTLQFEPPLATTRDDHFPLGESVLLREGVPTMPPGRRIEALFDLSHVRKDSGLPMRYAVTVNLRNARGKEETPQRYTIDLSHMYGLTHFTEYGLHHAAKSINEIEKAVKRWTGSQGRLNVWARDEDRRLLDDEAEEFLTGHSPTLAYAPPPTWLLTLARNSFARALVKGMPPLHRWLRDRLRPAE